MLRTYKWAKRRRRHF